MIPAVQLLPDLFFRFVVGSVRNLIEVNSKVCKRITRGHITIKHVDGSVDSGLR